MEALVKPRRKSVFGVPHSTPQLVTLPSASFTSIQIQECGLIHSILVTVPRSLSGVFESNSAAKEWCARIGTAAASISPMAPRAIVSLDFISISPVLILHRGLG